MFEPKYATLASRVLAHLIDQIIFAILIIVQGFIIVKIAPQFADWLHNLSRNVIESIIIVWLYYAITESSPLQASLGKLALRLKITDLQEEKISFGRATLRFFLAFLSSFTFIGLLMGGFTKHKQMLHDILSKCLVIKR